MPKIKFKHLYKNDYETSQSSFLTIFLLSSHAFTVLAQQTTVFTEANLAYKRGMDFYEKGIYNIAQQEFYTALTQLRPVPEPEARLLRGKAELFYAKSAVRAGQPNGEQLMLDYIRTYQPDPLATQASIEMGDYYSIKTNLIRLSSFITLLSRATSLLHNAMSCISKKDIVPL
ncbi:MAG: hypothetical protein HC817_03390 [Saprospiraceae bacterium]|nr:hypothetical protein [Saprospiraceae bacterium]